MIPFLFLLTSSMTVGFIRKVQSLPSGTKKTLVLLAISTLIIVSIALPLKETVQEAVRLSSADSRIEATTWIAENLPSNARIGLEARGPYVDPQQFSIEPSDIPAHTPDWYADNGFDYLVLSELTWQLYFREPDRHAEAIARYEALFDAFELVKVFSAGGYEVRIYAVTDQ